MCINFSFSCCVESLTFRFAQWMDHDEMGSMAVSFEYQRADSGIVKFLFALVGNESGGFAISKTFTIDKRKAGRCGIVAQKTPTAKTSINPISSSTKKRMKVPRTVRPLPKASQSCKATLDFRTSAKRRGGTGRHASQ